MLKKIFFSIDCQKSGIPSKEVEKLAHKLQLAGCQTEIKCTSSLTEAVRECAFPAKQCMLITDHAHKIKEGMEVGMVCAGCAGSQGEGPENAVYILRDLGDIEASYIEMIYCHLAGEAYTIARTDRMILREMTVEDVDRFYEIYAQPGITAYMEGLYEDREQEREFTREYIRQMYGFYEYGMWCICLPDGYVIGRAGLCHREINGEPQLEVGYVLDKNYQHQGYATEALKETLRYAKEQLGAPFVNAFIQIGNQASVRLIKRLGFQYLCTEILDDITYEIYRKLL